MTSIYAAKVVALALARLRISIILQAHPHIAALKSELARHPSAK
jgi:ABC-type uncharacterized transport system substrate-binding protein